jgi:hypothetical protein
VSQNTAYQTGATTSVALKSAMAQDTRGYSAGTCSSDEKHNRMAALRNLSPGASSRVDAFIDLSVRGLPSMYARRGFVQTVRSIGTTIRPEGDNLRYAAICALGLALVNQDSQRAVLDGSTASDLAIATVARAEPVTDDPGAVALAAWAAAEVAGHFASKLFGKLEEILTDNRPLATVDCAWTLIAATAAKKLGNTDRLARRSKDRLLAAQGSTGLFPPMLPSGAAGKLRAHVGSFADQVYPTMALARYSVAMADPAALKAADACGARFCDLQGPAGQWWWHYDARHGSVVEGYPVYSVHQHAMAPMALLDLREAGGQDHFRSVLLGLEWIDRHPEVSAPMVDEVNNVIWRKVGRREPKKAVRAISALTTGISPGMKLPGLDALFPAAVIDRECRPYELGWLLYAWLGGGLVRRLEAVDAGSSE